MSITLYNQYIYKNGEWKLVGTSIDPPTKTSDLTNDSGFITAADIPVESVNGETGAVVLDAADVGAQPTITANGILKANGSGTVTAATAGTDYQAPLPSQSGNSGKYLTTNGTAMSWGEVDALPSQTGNSGKFLTTDGTAASWTAITQDDHKWGTAALDRTQEGIANDTYVPQFDSTSDTTAKLAIATKTPANYAVAKYDGSAYLHSTTPTSSDNSTKVATTAYVDTAVGAITYPVTSVNTKTGAVSLTASDVGALPDSTTIPQGTVTSVRVQATSPVQSSTNTAQSTTLNTTISLADGYGDTKNPYAAKGKNTVLAGPSTGTATAPSFRSLEADDIPSLTVSKISDFPSTMTPSSHTHGDITNSGDITTTATIANGDRLVINDESASKITNSSITFGTSETTYLTNKGTWKTPDYPVTSVNTKTGAVSLTASDVGALPDTTEVPTATSDLTNDSGFITSSDIPVTSVNTKTGAVSLSASDVGALPDSTDVTKWNGVALNKSDAQNNGTVYVPFLDNTTSTTAYITQATSTPTAGRIAKYNSSSYLFSTTPSASDNSTKVATTAYVDSAINELGSLLTFKGVVATTGDLPGSGNDVGDVWVVSEDNSEHVWTGEAWERLGTTIDLSGYVPTSRTINSKALTSDITLSASDVGALPSSTEIPTWSFYGTSSTTASTAAKVVTCSNFVYKSGVIIGVLFSTANTAATPTLNVNSTGAKSIYVGASTPSATTNVLKWSANTMVYFLCDGTNYRYLTSVSAASVTPSRGANTWYGTSNTSASTQAKTSTIDNYVLTKGSLISITFSTANTYTTAKITLNINSTGAKDIYYNGAVTSNTNTLLWNANETLTFIYDGTGYYFVTKTTPILSSTDITTALGYTPYNSTNPNNYITSAGAPVQSVNTKTGTVTLTASDVGALPDSTSIPSKTSDLTNDSGFISGLTILSYGSSTWNDFLTAYQANKVVYCKASSNTNPGTGDQNRLAFLAYVNNPSSPTEVEFQYYRSVSTHSDSQQGDQVFVYKLNSSGTWSVTLRDAFTKIIAGTGLGSSYSNGELTLSNTTTAPVTSVNTQTGDVVLTASDVNALPDTTEIPSATSDLTNDSGFITSSDIPVTSVNTQTGAVSLTASDVGAQPAITTSGILKGNGSGGISAAVAGTDYQAPISNNVTGSGTSGYIAKFNGANTITNGPALGTATTTYLRNDGSWATPTNTTTGTTYAAASIPSNTTFCTQGSVVNVYNATKHTTATASLAVASWNSSNQQSVTVSGVTSSNLVQVSPAPASFSAASSAGIYCSAQASNSLTFTCSSKPSVAITMNVVIWS